MTVEKYLKKLEKSLKSLPETDREEIFEYYQEYFQECSDPQEVMENLPPPKQLVGQLKKSLNNENGADTLGALDDLDRSITLNLCKSAKKQVLFVAVFTLTMMVICSICHSFMPDLFFDNYSGASTNLDMALLFSHLPLCALGLFLLNRSGQTTAFGLEFFPYYLKSLAMFFVPLYFFMVEFHLPYAFVPVLTFVENLPHSTPMEWFFADISFHLVLWSVPHTMFFFLATVILLPVNYLLSKRVK